MYFIVIGMDRMNILGLAIFVWWYVYSALCMLLYFKDTDVRRKYVALEKL